MTKEIEEAILTLEVLIDEYKENGSSNANKEWEALDVFRKLLEENTKLKKEVRAVNRGLRKVISKRKKWKDRYYREREKINELKKENKHGSKKDV